MKYLHFKTPHCCWRISHNKKRWEDPNELMKIQRKIVSCLGDDHSCVSCRGIWNFKVGCSGLSGIYCARIINTGYFAMLWSLLSYLYQMSLSVNCVDLMVSCNNKLLFQFHKSIHIKNKKYYLSLSPPPIQSHIPLMPPGGHNYHNSLVAGNV